jgi:recombination associated protein RdgC
MADWLVAGEAPANFTIDRDCELKAADGEKPVVRYARHALDIDEIREHIQAGKQPTRLALTWRDRVSFTLTEGLQLKKIAFLDGVFEGQAKPKGDEGFDADAAIATGELAPMIDDLIDALGGEQVIGAAAPVAGVSGPVAATATATAADAALARPPSPAADLPPWESAEA